MLLVMRYIDRERAREREMGIRNKGVLIAKAAEVSKDILKVSS
jgi:hypothetical protein